MSNFGTSEIIGIIQILIGICAISLAVLAYRKVLKQIDISNQQTQLTLDQIGSLNKERQADLKIKLFVEINKQIRQYAELKKNYEIMTREISHLGEATKNITPSISPLVKDLEYVYKEKKRHNLAIINRELSSLDILYNDVFHNDLDVTFLENALQTITRSNKEADQAEIEFKEVRNMMDGVNQQLLHKH